MSHKIKVQLADKSGHSQMLMSPAETVETIQQNSSSWVYADNQLVQADQETPPPFPRVALTGFGRDRNTGGPRPLGGGCRHIGDAHLT